MTAMDLEGHAGAKVAIDVCSGCQAIWFDKFEDLQLSPGSTLKLFTLIGEQSAARRSMALSAVLRCPRCTSRLLPTHDRQRDTPFQYWRCDHQHGRLIGFFDFLREKNFIRPLSPQQLAELRQNIQTVNCSNCGAPIDLSAHSTCTHCGSPISMLDMKQAQEMVSQLRQAAEPHAVDPTLPLELARVRREVEASFGSLGTGADFWQDASSSGLVEAGLGAVLKWLGRSR
jgi:DNA-directed RNA polymerase subunit RPC12/RpoP